MTLDEALSRPTVSIPDAGEIFYDLSRSAAYEAAKKGHIPTIRVGGRILVPVAQIAAQLGLKTKFGQV